MVKHLEKTNLISFYTSGTVFFFYIFKPLVGLKNNLFLNEEEMPSLVKNSYNKGILYKIYRSQFLICFNK